MSQCRKENPKSAASQRRCQRIDVRHSAPDFSAS